MRWRKIVAAAIWGCVILGALPLGAATGVVPPARAQTAHPDGSAHEDPLARNLAAIAAHVARHIGPISGHVHPDGGGDTHIDVLIAPGRDATFLVTSGASDFAMDAPSGLEELSRIELVLALPPEWPLDAASRRDARIAWPFELLRAIATLPHAHGVWVHLDHSFGGGADMFPGSPFSGALLIGPISLPEPFFELDAPSGDTIHFLQVVPLTPEEVAFKQAEGAERLLDKLGADALVVDLARSSVVPAQ